MMKIKKFLHIFFVLRVLVASYQQSPKTAEITEGVFLAIGYDVSNMILIEGFSSLNFYWYTNFFDSSRIYFYTCFCLTVNVITY